MPLFFYIARDSNGNIVNGTVEAISVQAARASLRQSDLETEEIHEATRDELQPSSLLSEIAFEPQEHVLETPDDNPPQQKKSSAVLKARYFPFIDTLRLYAGWLLAWYALVYAFGSYQSTRTLPWNVPYVEALLPPYSEIVFSFTIASFIFLLMTSIMKAVGGGTLRTVVATIIGVLLFVLYRMNV